MPPASAALEPPKSALLRSFRPSRYAPSHLSSVICHLGAPAPIHPPCQTVPLFGTACHAPWHAVPHLDLRRTSPRGTPYLFKRAARADDRREMTDDRKLMPEVKSPAGWPLTTPARPSRHARSRLSTVDCERSKPLRRGTRAVIGRYLKTFCTHHINTRVCAREAPCMGISSPLQPCSRQPSPSTRDIQW